jgi:Leucine-rich repeat (LRR) protein
MLSGNIPETLGNLTNLQILSLRENQLSGTYPAYIQRYTFREIMRGAGEIPASIGNLTSLTILHLNTNQLTGA